MGPRLVWAVNDTATMVGRSLRHIPRNIESLLMSVMLPVMLMLLFVYVFGGAIDTGTEYVNYVVPGIILLCAGFGASMTAVSVASDMLNGVVDRLRSMPILSSAVLTGHVVSSLARNALATGLVLGVAYLAGFRPTATALEWVAAAGILLLFVLAISWVSVCLGLIAKSVDAANGFTFVFAFLPYVSSAFVPTETMPAVLHAFARNQPVTPVIETLRGLLMGTPIGSSAVVAVAWFGGILVVSYVLAAVLFRRRTAR
jgi:ABC-2 type transport system permease protein